LRAAAGAERSCFGAVGLAIVMVRDRSSSHWPHHAMVGGKERRGG
jgi:hypothetical protein